MTNLIQPDEYLPAPTPGYDPKWWWLDARTGWLEALLDNVEKLGDALSLKPAPGSGRSLGEQSGSFGGLTLPANVAVGPDCTIYLLDLEEVQLKRFDPCECRFQVVPCIAGSGNAPRQLLKPRSIGIMGGNLYICDTGNAQIKVFSLPSFALRAVWTLPARDSSDVKWAAVRASWKPYDLAFDSRGCIYVSDPPNGMVHRFAPSGRLLEPSWEGLSSPTYMAMDCDDRLYVLGTDQAGKPGVVVLDKEGNPTPVDADTPPEALAPYFATATPLPFPTDAQGNLYLGALCVDGATCWESICPTDCKRPNPNPNPNQATRNAQRAPDGVFDSRGNPLCNPPAEVRPSYQTQGYYYSRPLDSALYRCQWHRIALYGEVPPGARVRVWTYTAESEQTADTIQDLPPEAWATGQIATSLQGGWDCLVRSGGGRYLWLKVQLRGDGSVTPRITAIKAEYPRISLSRYLPAVFLEEPTSADFTDRFLGLFDTTLRSIEATLDTQARFFDPGSAPAAEGRATGSKGRDFLSWLASWIGVTFDRYQSVEKRRQALKSAASLYQIRGTREGLRRQLMIYLGMDSGRWASSPTNVGVPSSGENDCTCGTRPRPRHNATCRPRPLNCAPPPPPARWEPPPLILEHFELRRWLFAGSSTLGDQSVLWGKSIVNRTRLDENAQVDRSQLITTQDPVRDPFHVYAHKFTVFVPAWVEGDPRYKRGIEKLLQAESPAHTLGTLRYVEPRFRIGVQSTVGYDAVVGCYPQGVTLGDAPLGQATVLTGSPGPESPVLRIR